MYGIMEITVSLNNKVCYHEGCMKKIQYVLVIFSAIHLLENYNRVRFFVGKINRHIVAFIYGFMDTMQLHLPLLWTLMLLINFVCENLGIVLI